MSKAHLPALVGRVMRTRGCPSTSTVRRSFVHAQHSTRCLTTQASPSAHITSPISPPTGHSLQQIRSITTAELDRTLNGRQRVVILGSGWAGFPLSRQLDPKKYQVVVVSPRSYFVFTPFLASTSVGTLEFRVALEPVRSKRSDTQFIQGWADDVSFHDKTITIEEAIGDPSATLAPTESRWRESDTPQKNESRRREGKMFDLSYDKLIISVGSYSQTFGIPGVKEHANFLKDVGDSRRIRSKLLECFELASLPTTPKHVREQLLHFAVVGGGPTGIEFSAELHDLISDDMKKLYPDLAGLARITVYDVAPRVLSTFDERLSQYAMDTFGREGINIKTSTHVEKLTPGLVNVDAAAQDGRPGVIMDIKGEGPVGVGMVVWSTGLQSNPFISKALDAVRQFPSTEDVIYKKDVADAEKAQWHIRHDKKTGSVMTNDRLRVLLQAEAADGEALTAHMRDVFAIGDCAVIENLPPYPATAQVANQKADWLAQRLNRDDLHTTRFRWKNQGIMAYVGGWRAIMQVGNDEGRLSGRSAWLLWRSAYLYKSMSWRNRILVPMYWLVNWLFGRDISRF